MVDEMAKWATGTGSFVALITLIVGVAEFRRQGAQKRADYFHIMRLHFKENTVFLRLCDLLEQDKEELAEISFKDKRELLGFFEEIALGLNSRLIRRKVAHYMFGYYAIRCWESTNFWSNVNRDSYYWGLFNSFVDDMKRIERVVLLQQKRGREPKFEQYRF